MEKIGKTIRLPLREWEVARAEIDRIDGRAVKAAGNVKRAYSLSWISELTGGPRVVYKRGRHPVVQALSDAAAGRRAAITDRDVEEVLRVVGDHANLLAGAGAATAERLAILRNDIELVTLDVLIARFRGMLAKRHSEQVWQRFLAGNPFILSFALGYPLVMVQDQASVGGRALSGGGEKVVDFLAKNPTTNNVAIVEIKKPSVLLMAPQDYRGNVHRPSAELAGAVVQVLDQRYQLTSDFAQRQRNSRTWDIESFAIRGCLIVGSTPSNTSEIKSFELFRDALANIEIVTFDELLARIELLRAFLAEPSPREGA